jgi:amino acid adenylation domain-containing protein
MVNSSERTNYPLAMAVDDTGSGFVLTALAHSSVQPQKTCQYLEQGLRELVDLLERAPATPIESLHVLPRAERHRVVEEWNRTDAKFEEGTLNGLFSAQARRTPNALAVVGRDGAQLTYADLETQSTGFARQLVAQGVYPQRVVGVRMERSSETIVALLAILKAGGIYLPLDPAYPKERLDYIAADAGATVVLNSIHGLAGECDIPQLTDPHRLAYIIYTSGTTGQPKGVAVSHAAPVNLAFARRAAHDPIGPGDRILAGISVGFDVSIGQLLLPLLSGATVVIAGDLKAMTASEFWAFLTRERVTHINSVPSFLDSILDAAPPVGTLALRRLMLGGEALSGALVSRIQSALPQVEVVNMYGPTEACIDATFHLATKADQAAAVLPIGRPLPNYRAYVLDRRLEPVGIGIPGELFLGGAGLAQGYVNKPELTAERFVADPFSTEPGARIYRTGDRARWREDGTLEFLGRVDEQVKIRGFRVEPAEIEAQLRNQPGIREAAVAYYERGARLVAYYTSDNVPAPEDLRAGMSAVLPDYMIPSAFVKLDQLPLSPNGKLDRKALPRELVRDAAHTYEAPHHPTQVAMQQIFESVLGVHPIGIHDNFFSLGGDSLAVMRLIYACNTQFKISLPLRTLFDHPTIEGLAAAVESGATQNRNRHLIALQPAGKKPKLFCIHPAGGHVFCYLPLAWELGADQPAYGLQASGLEEGETPATSIEQAAADYIEAIRTVQPEGPYQLLGMSSGGLIAYEMARQIKERGGVISFLGLLDTTVPGSENETIFSEEYLVRAMAGELGCEDLLKDAPPALTLPQLVEMGILAGRLPAGFGLAQAERLAAVFRNSVDLHLAYRPGNWDGPMLLLRALRRLRDEDAPPDWSPFVTGTLEVHDLDCEHSDLVSAHLSSTVAALVASHLS